MLIILGGVRVRASVWSDRTDASKEQLNDEDTRVTHTYYFTFFVHGATRLFTALVLL